MEWNPFTVEEENLICIYDISNRTALKASIVTAYSYSEDSDINEIMRNILNKLDSMSDEDFSAMTFCPAYDDDDESEV